MSPPSSSIASESVELEISSLASPEASWMTAPTYYQDVTITLSKFNEVTDVLLDQPNLNSTHLFRADILYDSAGILQTRAQKEDALSSRVNEASSDRTGTEITSASSTIRQKIKEDTLRTDQSGFDEVSPGVRNASILAFAGFELKRIVLRKLIPRKPQVDQPLDQSCFILDKQGFQEQIVQRLVVYRPHVPSVTEMPWYHPPVKALAFLYNAKFSDISISVHFLPFETMKDRVIPTRLHRTFLSLLGTIVRLSKPKSCDSSEDSSLFHQNTANLHKDKNNNNGNYSLAPSALKDTILPQHTVQDTYTRLKQQYSRDLIERWVENTEPSKHVFEDLSIAAFLIELWKQMYPPPQIFPGFVDVACGNGVLVYILLKEGYGGEGFDARRRKTWEILEIDEHLTEQLCIPLPFLKALDETIESVIPGTRIHSGVFPASIFIISNHADELTPWTPLLASLSCPSQPNPFLAIPCCSHALSGVKYRYSHKDSQPQAYSSGEQPLRGDLRALRESKARNSDHMDDKSTYGCLTRKVVRIAEDVGCQIELTLMRIPSTRNIGIVGNRKIAADIFMDNSEGMQQLPVESESREAARDEEIAKSLGTTAKIEKLIERECAMSGGITFAARTWIEHAQSLQNVKGRGKLNLRRHKETPS